MFNGIVIQGDSAELCAGPFFGLGADFVFHTGQYAPNVLDAQSPVSCLARKIGVLVNRAGQGPLRKPYGARLKSAGLLRTLNMEGP